MFVIWYHPFINFTEEPRESYSKWLVWFPVVSNDMQVGGGKKGGLQSALPGNQGRNYHQTHYFLIAVFQYCVLSIRQNLTKMYVRIILKPVNCSVVLQQYKIYWMGAENSFFLKLALCSV